MKAFACFLAVLALPAVALAAPKFATVNVENSVLHVGPDATSAVVTNAVRGTVLQVDGLQGNWVHVKTQGGLPAYVVKTDLVPGKKTLAELPPLAGASPTPGTSPTPAATPKVAAGATPTPGPKVAAGATPTPTPGAKVAAATPAPTPDYPTTPDTNGARESRRGLAVRVGPVVATSSYKLDDGGSTHRASTRYLGAALDVDYWLLDSLGTHLRVASASGSTSTRVSPSTSVSGIAAEVREIQLDLLGRFIIGSSPTAPALVGGLGFHRHEVIVDSVKVGGNSVGPVSQSYQGAVIGLGGDVPLGSPSAGIQGRVEYWLAPGLTEPGSASGKSDGVSGMGIVFGGYSRLTDSIRVDAGVEHQSFEGKFKGNGFRFNEPVRNARSSDRYTIFVVSGSYTF